MRFTFFLFVSVLLLACGGSNPQPEPVLHSDFRSEKILVDLNYPEYPDTIIPHIMSQLGLCEFRGFNISDTLKLAPCEHQLLRVFMNHQGENWEDGFLVEVKANVYSPDYRVISVVKSEGKYKISNDYSGELLEMRTTPEGMYDLIIRYRESEIGTVAIYHEWRVNHYEPTTVVEINDHFVKEEKMDSLNKVYIDNFSWGF